MVGKVVGHAEGDGELLQLEFENFSASGARVLEVAMPLIRDGVHVGQDFAQGTLSAVGFGVFGTSKPTEEVGGTVVESVRNEMVTDTYVLFASLWVGECWPRPIESERHEDVAGFTAS